MKIKKILALIIAALLFVTGCSNNGGGETTTQAGTSASQQNSGDGAKYVIKVGDEALTEDVFAFYANMQANLYRSSYGSDVLEQTFNGEKLGDIIKANLVDSFSRDLTIVAALKKEGFAPDEKTVTEKFDEFKALTPAENYEMFIKQGATEETLKEDVRRSLYVEEYLARLNKAAEESDEYKELLKTEVVQVKARHILVETEEEAKKVLELVKAGEKSFSELASEFSKDEMSKVNGGDLGYFGAGVMIPEFETAAFALNPGDVSDIVPSVYGYHIILCEDKRTVEKMIADEADATDIENAKILLVQKIVQRTYMEKVNEDMKKFALEVNQEFIDNFVFKSE